jgi:uncharacterized Zn finger protein
MPKIKCPNCHLKQWSTIVENANGVQSKCMNPNCGYVLTEIKKTKKNGK